MKEYVYELLAKNIKSDALQKTLYQTGHRIDTLLEDLKDPNKSSAALEELSDIAVMLRVYSKELL